MSAEHGPQQNIEQSVEFQAVDISYEPQLLKPLRLSELNGFQTIYVREEKPQVKSPFEDMLLTAYANDFSTYIDIARAVGAGDYLEAEEIVQGAFVKAWDSLTTFDGRHINGWLTKIIRNKVIDKGRKTTRASQYLEHGNSEELEWKMGYLESKGEAVEDTVVRKETSEELIALLDKIPTIQKQVVELHVNGYTLSEIADVLEIPIGTVKSRLSRGLSALRKLIS